MNWTKTWDQIAFLQKIWKTLDITHQEQQSQILDMLATKLNAAITQVKRVQRKNQGKDDEAQINRWKYAMIKESIDKAIQDLETWQKRFDPSWFLILKMADPVIDRELAEGSDNRTSSKSMSTARSVRQSLKADAGIQTTVFLSKDGLTAAQRESIPYCTAELVQRSAKSNKLLIVDRVPCLPEVNARILREDVRDLARKLSATDPITFGLLKCHGVVKVLDEKHERPSSFDFVFLVPPGLKSPRSLRHILLSPDAGTSLSDRFRVAQQLAQSVSYVHTCGFVHKSIRPETVLIFETDTSVLNASFLLGFEKFRTARSGHTLRAGDCAWEKDLYRHPRRQGLKPEDEYTMQHDIYSLGVCLLEIGLWESLILIEGEALPSKLLPDYVNREDDNFRKASLVKNSLVELAKQKLPSRMGDKYTVVVVNCLTCLDDDNMDFGDESEFEDEDGILIGLRYIEKVSRRRLTFR